MDVQRESWREIKIVSLQSSSFPSLILLFISEQGHDEPERRSQHDTQQQKKGRVMDSFAHIESEVGKIVLPFFIKARYAIKSQSVDATCKVWLRIKVNNKWRHEMGKKVQEDESVHWTKFKLINGSSGMRWWPKGHPDNFQEVYGQLMVWKFQINFVDELITEKFNLAKSKFVLAN